MQNSSFDTSPHLKSFSISTREKHKLLIHESFVTGFPLLYWSHSSFLIPPHIPTAQVLFSLVCRPPAYNVFPLFFAPVPPCTNLHPCNSFFESYLFNPGSFQGSCIACGVHIPLHLSGFNSGNHFLWECLSDSPPRLGSITPSTCSHTTTIMVSLY